MDKRLQQALDFSQYMTTLNNQKRLLLEKFYENCILYYNGGKFTVTPELISYCGTFIYSDEIVIDDNKLPIQVKTRDFKKQITEHYNLAKQKYFDEYNKVKAKRSVEKFLDE